MRAVYIHWPNNVEFIGHSIIVANFVGNAYGTYSVLGKNRLRYVEKFPLIMISCIPGLSTFYLGTFKQSRFYSSLQYGHMYRMWRSERTEGSNIPSIEDDINKYNKSNKYNPLLERQTNLMHSTKSLVGSSKDISIELAIVKILNASPYSKLAKQSKRTARWVRLWTKLSRKAWPENRVRMVVNYSLYKFPIHRELDSC